MGESNGHAPHLGLIICDLENDRSADEYDVLEKLAWSKSVVEEFSGHAAHLYKIREEPSRLVEIQGWQSVEAHYQDFHDSEAMDAILQEFGGILDIKSSWHADIPLDDVKLDAPTLTLSRFFVLNSKKAEFDEKLADWTAGIAKFAGSKLVSGWRMKGGWNDQDLSVDHLDNYDERMKFLHSKQDTDPDDTTEWDILLPWDSVEQWRETTGNREKMKPFFELLEYVARLEVLHLDPLTLPPVDESRHNHLGDDEGDDESDDEH